MDVAVILMKRMEIGLKFLDAATIVYWDVEDFPVTDIVSFKQSLKLALDGAGYHGNISITAYGDPRTSPDQYEAAGIKFVPKDSKRLRMHNMSVDMHMWALDNPTHALTNLMVIAKDMSPLDDEDDDLCFLPYISDLNLSCYNVLLAVPDDFQPEGLGLECNYTIWTWRDLSAGGRPIPYSRVYRPLPQVNLQGPCSHCGK